MLISEGQKTLFTQFYPGLINKVIVVHPGIIIKQTRKQIIKKIANTKTINFLCLASDYLSKGVDLIIKSFKDVGDTNQVHLILVCNNIPEVVKRNLPSNIELVTIPGTGSNSETLKETLFKRAHVGIVFSHTDTSAALMEVLSYGLPLITLRNQHTKDFIANANGFEIDVPFYLYDYGYATKWKTMDDYSAFLNRAKKRGEFNSVVRQLSDRIRFFSQNIDQVRKMSINSYILAKESFSISKRNNALRKIYHSSLEYERQQ